MNFANFDWMGTLINWFPMLLIFAVWLIFIRQLRPTQKAGVERQERQTAALERIAAALEKRG